MPARTTSERRENAAAGSGAHEAVVPFERLVERAPESMFVVRNDRITFLNAAARILLERVSDQSPLGAPFVDCFHRDCQADVLNVMRQAATSQTACSFEARLACTDRSPVDVEGAASRVGLNDGNTLVMLRDLTARSRAEAALRASEERLTLAFAGAQEGVWDWDLETGAVVYSQRWTQMLGYDDTEIEPHVTAWERLLHPDDIGRAKALNERVARGEDPTYAGEFRLRHK